MKARYIDRKATVAAALRVRAEAAEEAAFRAEYEVAWFVEAARLGHETAGDRGEATREKVAERRPEADRLAALAKLDRDARLAVHRRWLDGINPEEGAPGWLARVEQKHAEAEAARIAAASSEERALAAQELLLWDAAHRVGMEWLATLRTRAKERSETGKRGRAKR